MKSTAAPKKNTESADHTSTVLEGNSGLGDVRIHENVIASLVRKAALGVEGISRLAGNALVDNIAEFVGSRRMQSRAITIDMDDNNRVAIEVKVNIIFGYNIPEVAQAVQKDGGGVGPGTVVEGQGHIFQVPGGDDGAATGSQGLPGGGQQGRQQQKPCQNTDFFHVITVG